MLFSMILEGVDAETASGKALQTSDLFEFTEHWSYFGMPFCDTDTMIKTINNITVPS